MPQLNYKVIVIDFLFAWENNKIFSSAWENKSRYCFSCRNKVIDFYLRGKTKIDKFLLAETK